jgi:hypothetical protein
MRHSKGLAHPRIFTIEEPSSTLNDKYRNQVSELGAMNLYFKRSQNQARVVVCYVSIDIHGSHGFAECGPRWKTSQIVSQGSRGTDQRVQESRSKRVCQKI